MHKPTNSAARILDAALTLFSEKGYDAASTREICELAGISAPTLYYFHKSKEDIYRGLARTAMNELAVLVNTGFNSAGDLRTKLRNVSELIFDYANRKPRLCRFIFAVGHSPNSPFAGDTYGFFLMIRRKLSAEVAAAMKAGEIGPGDCTARGIVLIGALAQAVSTGVVQSSPKLTRKLAHSLMDTILDGWLPAKTRVSR